MEKTDVLDRRVRLEDIYATLVNAVAKTRNESTQKDAALASAIDPRIETVKLHNETTSKRNRQALGANRACIRRRNSRNSLLATR